MREVLQWSGKVSGKCMGTESRERRMPPYSRTIGGCFVGATLAVARTAAADVDLGDRKGRPYISLRT